MLVKLDTLAAFSFLFRHFIIFSLLDILILLKKKKRQKIDFSFWKKKKMQNVLNRKNMNSEVIFTVSSVLLFRGGVSTLRTCPQLIDVFFYWRLPLNGSQIHFPPFVIWHFKHPPPLQQFPFVQELVIFDKHRMLHPESSKEIAPNAEFFSAKSAFLWRKYIIPHKIGRLYYESYKAYFWTISLARFI